MTAFRIESRVRPPVRFREQDVVAGSDAQPAVAPSRGVPKSAGISTTAAVSTIADVCGMELCAVIRLFSFLIGAAGIVSLGNSLERKNRLQNRE